VIDNSDTRRRAGITADQFSNNGLRFSSWGAISPNDRAA
jgi:hypothetical protein